MSSSASVQATNDQSTSTQTKGTPSPEQMQDVLKDISDVIVKHGLEEHVGVFSRQFHFRPGENTVLLECTESPDESYIVPISRNDLASNARAKSWIFPDGKPTPYCYCRELTPEEVRRRRLQG